MSDLKLMTIDEICEELQSRCESMILQMDGVPYSGLREGHTSFYSCFHGNLTTCLGMTIEMQNKIVDRQKQ